jgi:hypothetical protein
MNIKSFSIIALFSVVLTSCLKSRDTLGLYEDKGTIVTEIADVNIFGDTKVVSVDDTPPTETIDLITLKFHSGRDAQPKGGIKVKLQKDDAAVTAAGLTLLPANSYTLPTLEFEIPAGTKELTIPITINKANLDLSQSYGLGLKIAEVSEGVISELAKSIVVNVLVKNKYDGHYRVTGTMTDLTSSALTGYYPMDADLETAGADAVLMFHHYFSPGYGHPILSGTSLSYYGGFVPVFIFDANNNVVAVVNGYGQGTNNRWGALDPTGVNKYDPATKTLRVSYTMNQPNATTVRTKFNETWTYLGPR